MRWPFVEQGVRTDEKRTLFMFCLCPVASSYLSVLCPINSVYFFMFMKYVDTTSGTKTCGMVYILTSGFSPLPVFEARKLTKCIRLSHLGKSNSRFLGLNITIHI